MSKIKIPFALWGFSLILINIFLMVFSKAVSIPLFICAFIICLILIVKKSRYTVHFFSILICIVIAVLSFTSQINKYEQLKDIPSKDVILSGEVSSYPEKSDKMFFFTISKAQINGIKINGNIKVYANYSDNILPGANISVKANSLQKIESEGIYRFHTLSNKIYLSAYTYDDIILNSTNTEKNIINKILIFRHKVNELLSGNINSTCSGIANALMTGEKDFLSEETILGFRASGISHIFAVSGMHLTLWTGLFFIIMKKRSRISFIPNLAAIVFVLFFTVFTGFSPSVLRSAIMLLSIFIASIIKRKADPLNSLGIASTILLIANPFLAGNISFLLSFFATFALICVAPHFLLKTKNKKTFNIHNFLIIISNILITSVCVIIVTLPLAALFFGYFSILSPISSLLLTPIAQIIMLLSGLGLFISSLGFSANIIFSAVTFFSKIILDYCQKAADIDIAIIPAKINVIIPWFIMSLLGFLIIFFIYNTNNTEFSLTNFLSDKIKNLYEKVQNYVKENIRGLLIKYTLSATLLLFNLLIICAVLNFGDTKLIVTNGGFAICEGTKADAICYNMDYNDILKLNSSINRNGILRTEKLFLYNSLSSKNNSTKYAIKKLLPKNTIVINSNDKNGPYINQISKNTSVCLQKKGNFFYYIIYSNAKKIILLPHNNISDDLLFSLNGDILICPKKLSQSTNDLSFNDIVILEEKYEEKNKFFNTSNTELFEIKIKGERNGNN